MGLQGNGCVTRQLTASSMKGRVHNPISCCIVVVTNCGTLQFCLTHRGQTSMGSNVLMNVGSHCCAMSVSLYSRAV